MNFKKTILLEDAKAEGQKEALMEMRKFSKELTCDETCKNNPISCELERRQIRAFQIIEERLKQLRGNVK